MEAIHRTKIIASTDIQARCVTYGLLGLHCSGWCQPNGVAASCAR